MTNYISRAEAEELCDELIRQFTGSTSSDPKPVDIDLFVRDYLKCTVLYESIAEDDADKIGFTGDGKRPLRVLKDGKPKDVIYLQIPLHLSRLHGEKEPPMPER